MTPEEVQGAIVRLKELQKIGDTETAHQQADFVVLECLIKLGFKEIVDEFNKIRKMVRIGKGNATLITSASIAILILIYFGL